MWTTSSVFCATYTTSAGRYTFRDRRKHVPRLNQRQCWLNNPESPPAAPIISLETFMKSVIISLITNILLQIHHVSAAVRGNGRFKWKLRLHNLPLGPRNYTPTRNGSLSVVTENARLPMRRPTLATQSQCLSHPVTMGLETTKQLCIQMM